MYWLPKIHKTLLGVRFIVASYYCSTNPLPDTIFKLIFNTVESFHKKLSFIQAVRNSVLCKNCFPIVTMLNKINVKKKSISNFDCSILYTTILHKFLLKVPSEVIIFVFKLKSENALASLKHLSIGLLGEDTGRRHFTKQTLVNPISFLMNKCFVTLLLKWFLNIDF